MDSLIKSQINRINQQQEILSKQLISQSKYAGMDRNSRRELETYVDSLNILLSQEKDIKKAQIVGERISEILERVRKQVDTLLNKVNDYNYPTTTTDTILDCSNLDSSNNQTDYDLTTDLVKREAWENAIITLSENILSYLNSQFLGDYALLHVPQCSNQCFGNTNVYYRPVFTYLQVVNNTFSQLTGGGVTTCFANTDFAFVINNPDLKYACFHNELLEDITNIQDETNLITIVRRLQNKLDEIREAQSKNDRDLSSLDSIFEVNEQNKLFYTKLIEQSSKIDEEEIKMKLNIGQSLIHDLRSLQKNCYDKSSYFSLSDIVSKF